MHLVKIFYSSHIQVIINMITDETPPRTNEARRKRDRSNMTIMPQQQQQQQYDTPSSIFAYSATAHPTPNKMGHSHCSSSSSLSFFNNNNNNNNKLSFSSGTPSPSPHYLNSIAAATDNAAATVSPGIMVSPFVGGRISFTTTSSSSYTTTPATSTTATDVLKLEPISEEPNNAFDINNNLSQLSSTSSLTFGSSCGTSTNTNSNNNNNNNAKGSSQSSILAGTNMLHCSTVESVVGCSIDTTTSSISSSCSSKHQMGFHSLHADYCCPPPMKRARLDDCDDYQCQQQQQQQQISSSSSSNDVDMNMNTSPVMKKKKKNVSMTSFQPFTTTTNTTKQEVQEAQPAHQQQYCTTMKKMIGGGSVCFNNNNNFGTTSSNGGGEGRLYCHVCSMMEDGSSISSYVTARSSFSNNAIIATAETAPVPTIRSHSLLSFFQSTKKPTASSSQAHAQKVQAATSFNTNQPPTQQQQPAQQQMAASSSNNNTTNLITTPLARPCRYCDKSTCSTCTRQCELCNYTFCTFCTKIDYESSITERIVCFDCDDCVIASCNYSYSCDMQMD